MVAIVLAVSAGFGEHPTWWALPFFFYGSNIIGNLQLPLGVGGHVQLGHLWSLSLEEQFYLLWPPLLFLLRKRENILRACIIGIIFSVALRAVMVLHPVGKLDVYNELPTQLDGLLAGGLLALLLRSEKQYSILRPKVLRVAIAVATLVVGACVYTGHTSHWSNPTMRLYGYFAATVVFFAVIALSLRPDTWTHRVGSWRLLRLLGRYSYGFYLWHQLPENFYVSVIHKAQAMVPVIGGPLGAAAVFAMSLACAVASYHLIELPFLRMKKFFAYGDEKRAHHLHADQAIDVQA
jgi:peptidoglycan/LPS O-acetylase OafA/YrhL